MHLSLSILDTAKNTKDDRCFTRSIQQFFKIISEFQEMQQDMLEQS